VDREEEIEGASQRPLYLLPAEEAADRQRGVRERERVLVMIEGRVCAIPSEYGKWELAKDFQEVFSQLDDDDWLTLPAEEVLRALENQDATAAFEFAMQEPLIRALLREFVIFDPELYLGRPLHGRRRKKRQAGGLGPGQFWHPLAVASLGLVGESL